MRISDWSSDVCSSDLGEVAEGGFDEAGIHVLGQGEGPLQRGRLAQGMVGGLHAIELEDALRHPLALQALRRALEEAGDVVLHLAAPGGGDFATHGGAPPDLVDADAAASDWTSGASGMEVGITVWIGVTSMQ